MVSRGDYPQMTLFQVSELLKFAQICDDDDGDDDENEWYGESSHTYPKLLVSWHLFQGKELSELPIFTIISFSRESTNTRFLEFAEQDFCHLPGKSNIWEIWEYEKPQDRPVDLEKPTKKHMELVKNMVTLSPAPGFFFDRRILLRRPRHRSRKVRRQSYRHSKPGGNQPLPLE